MMVRSTNDNRLFTRRTRLIRFSFSNLRCETVYLSSIVSLLDEDQVGGSVHLEMSYLEPSVLTREGRRSTCIWR